MLDFRIETFLCVCKHMNYTKAAQELNITQPGVSQHIKYLENYYGDRLFEYSNKSLELTRAGMDLRNAMLSIKQDTIQLKRRIQVRASEGGSVRFGATLTIGEFMLPNNLISLIKNNSRLQVEFTIADTRKLLSLLEAGSIDFAIVEGYFEKGEYDYITVSREAYRPVCGRNYPLEEIRDFQELLGHNLIVREEGSGTKEILERYLSEKGYSIKDFARTTTISSIHIIKHLLENNCGISFLYEIAVKKELEANTLRSIELPDFPLYHEFNFIWRKNSVFKEYYHSLFSLIVSSVQEPFSTAGDPSSCVFDDSRQS